MCALERQDTYLKLHGGVCCCLLFVVVGIFELLNRSKQATPVSSEAFEGIWNFPQDIPSWFGTGFLGGV